MKDRRIYKRSSLGRAHDLCLVKDYFYDLKHAFDGATKIFFCRSFQ